MGRRIATTLVLAALATLAAPTLAADPPRASERELAAVSELGRVNGIALACQRPELVTKAKALMLARVPKSRRYGEAFEEATSAAFRDQGSQAADCPEEAILGLRLEAADLRLMEVFPPMVPQ